jgi:hypothetical protein
VALLQNTELCAKSASLYRALYNLYRIKSCTGYYHQVNSFGSHNIAVAILFSRLDKLEKYNDTGCGNSSYVPLSQLDVDWKYPGYGRMTMGNAHLETAR